MKLPCHHRLTFAIFFTLPWPIALNPVNAQIVPDGTLGDERSVITSIDEVIDTRSAQVIQRITKGAIRGENLFHSFEQFNIADGESAYFDNPVGIETILSRVTGNDISDIFGTLGVDGDANLLFLNPNGIVFGPNARLDIAGSFVASTGDRFTFPDGSSFSATEPNVPPLLSVNLTPGLQLGTGASSIINDGQLIAGQDLTLHGGELDLEGQLGAYGELVVRGDRVQIRDSAATPFIAQSGGALTIEGNTIDIFALNHPDSGLVSGGDMVLRSSSPVGGDVHYWSGGDFRIEKLDRSLGDLSSPHDPIIRATGDVVLNNYQGASLHILAGGSVTLGSVAITGADNSAASLSEQVTLQDRDRTMVSIDGSAEPTLDVRAGVDQAFVSPPLSLGTLPAVGSTNEPTSAGINIESVALGEVQSIPFLGEILLPIPGKILLTNQYQPNDALSGKIQVREILTGGGEVFINSRGSIQLLAGGSIQTTSLSNDIGRIILDTQDEIVLEPDFKIRNRSLRGTTGSGGVDITARTFLMSERSEISTTTFSAQNGGDIQLNIQESVILEGDRFEEATFETGRVNTLIASTVEGNATGKGGIIRIDSESLDIRNGAFILTSANSISGGIAGDVDINVRGDINIDGTELSINRPRATTGIDARLFENAVGQGGNIDIQARNLLINAAGFPSIRTDSRGQGSSGNIQIRLDKVEGSLELRNSSAIAATLRQGATGGEAGSITIEAAEILVSDGSLIASDTEVDGSAGVMRIYATELVEITGLSPLQENSGLFTSTRGSGAGGELFIDAGQLIVRDGGVVSSVTSSDGQAGNLTVNATELVEITGLFPVQENTGLFTSTSGSGAGGELFIDTGQLIVRDGGVVSSATRVNGQAGNTTVIASESIAIRGEDSAVTALTSGKGDAGILTLTTQDLTIADGAEARVSSIGESVAGDLIINANTVSLMNNAGLNAETEAGKGANIELQVDEALLLQDGSNISATTQSGTGGSIAVQGVNIVQLNNNSSISSSSEDGIAGSITINIGEDAAEQIVLRDKSEMAAQATAIDGNAGDINLNSQAVILQNGANISASNISSSEGGNIILTVEDRLRLENDSEISASTESGQGGRILLDELNSLRVQNSQIRATASTPSGSAGSIEGNIAGAVLLSGRFSDDQQRGGISVSASGGQAGALDLNTSALTVRNGAELSVSNELDGRAGNLSITAGNATLNQDGLINARTDAGGGGNIFLDIDSKLTLRNNSEISASTIDGVGGSIALNVNADPTPIVRLNGGRIATEATETGNAGRLLLNVESLSLNNDSTLTAATDSGAGGDIAFRGMQQLNIRGNSQISASTEDGDAGRITLNRNQPAADVLRLRNGQIATQADGNGDAGRINLNTQALFMDSESRISASTQSGLGGDIVIRGITTAQLDNSEISALTLRGMAGSLNLRASDTIDLNNSSLSVEATRKRGSAGNLTVVVPQLTLANGSEILASNRASLADERDITLAIDDMLHLQNNGVISATTQSGRGGDIVIRDVNDIFLDNSVISSSARDGEAGQMNVNASETIRLSGTRSDKNPGGLLVESRRSNGGDLTVQASQLIVEDDAIISASTLTGNAGDVTVRVGESIYLTGDRTEVSARARQLGGIAGSVDIQANHLLMENNAAILTSNRDAKTPLDSDAQGNITLSGLDTLDVRGGQISAETRTGDAGNVAINASELVRLSGGAVLSVKTESEDDSRPDERTSSSIVDNESRRDVRDYEERNTAISDLPIAGSLSIQTERLDVEDDSSILVSSPNGQAGSVGIEANQMFLDNGEVRATTFTDSINGDESANVEISGLDFLLFENGSLISAEALDSASGGNIALNAESGFIIALPQENSDIIATAEGGGDGGSIRIRTQRLFGLQENSGLFEQLRSNPANEMSVTSSLGLIGTIALEQLGIEPVQAVAELPNDLRPPLLGEGCRPGTGKSTFINIERGGIPLGPEDQIDGDELWEYLLPGQQSADWMTTEAFSGTVDILQANSQDVGRAIAEVDGWTIREDGQVILRVQPTLAVRPHPCLSQ
ncbi:MAG: filamentous hemagglutinin N-terminal domain-containing protein [Cyanobacteria bacterium P01_F01_bin.150]